MIESQASNSDKFSNLQKVSEVSLKKKLINY